MPVEVKLKNGTSRELTMTLNRAGLFQKDIDALFDAERSETTDPIEAIEADCGGELVRLIAGDRIDVSVEIVTDCRALFSPNERE